MKLNKSTIDSLLVPEKDVIYWDDQLKGFGVKISPNGKRVYVLQSRVNGISRRVTLGKHGIITCDEARKKAMAVLIDFSNGLDPRTRKPDQKTTLADVVDDYCENRRTKNGGKLKVSSIADIRRHLRTNFSDWAQKPVDEINSQMCRMRFEKISANTPTQANQAFRILRALLNFSADEDNPRPNPCNILRQKRLWNKNNARNGYIPLITIGAAWNMLQERQKLEQSFFSRVNSDIIIFILLTGCRWSEAAKLTWNCVNLLNATWHIPDPKNHHAVTLPLSTPLQAMLREYKCKSSSDFVFPGYGKSGHIASSPSTMEEISKIAGLHLTPHDLRRTFIQIGIKLKIEMWKLKLLTNHIAKGDVTIDHYTETSNLTYLNEEIEQIAAWLVEQGKIAAASNVVQFKAA